MAYSPPNKGMHSLALRLGGQISVLFTGGGLILFAALLPAPSPLDSAEVVARRFADNAVGIQIGNTLMLIGFSLWVPWSAAVAAWARRIEKGAPILSYAMIISGAVAVFIVVLIAFLWALAAFRPGEISPEITMTLNDGGWLMFLIPWAPFTVWAILFALLVLQDDSEEPLVPRWVAGLSFCFGLILVLAFAPLIFKSGTFAYDGLIGMIIPLMAFEGWKTTVTQAMLKGLKKSSGPVDYATTPTEAAILARLAALDGQAAGPGALVPSRPSWANPASAGA